MQNENEPKGSDPSNNDNGGFRQLPPDQGLYSSDQEKDSCGVGFLVNIDGTRSHAVVQDAATVSYLKLISSDTVQYDSSRR
jgi:hypothetical protein